MQIPKIRLKKRVRKSIMGWLLIIDISIILVFLLVFMPFWYSLTWHETVEVFDPAFKQAHAEIKPNAHKSLISDRAVQKVISVPLGIQAASTRVCARLGLSHIQCRNDLIAISYHETQRFTRLTGDSGCSVGWFHINRCVHKNVEKKLAYDYEQSALWTLQRMARYGYPEFRTRAIQCHNGCLAKNGYASKIKSISAQINR